MRNSEGGGHPNSIPFHRLYVGNIHFNVTEQDLEAVFSPFGELEFVQLQKDDSGRSRGYGFVQYDFSPFPLPARRGCYCFSRANCKIDSAMPPRLVRRWRR